LHFRTTFDPDVIVPNALFADGAAAVVGRSADARVPSDADTLLAASGSYLVPDSEELMSWRVREDAFRMSLSPRLPMAIQAHLASWLSQWLRQHDLVIEDVRYWAVHPGGVRVLHAVQTALSLSSEQIAASHAVLRRFGNMSSPTVLFVLDHLRREKAPPPWVALAFGPGLTIEALLFV
ncbi:MAG: hypothetical protein KDD69_06190, partial [Bdellovibrionales bacterium]|nr:hypothetical protein [Bdellovibrionales bacterium]